jgi:hypothetical protein
MYAVTGATLPPSGTWANRVTAGVEGHAAGPQLRGIGPMKLRSLMIAVAVAAPAAAGLQLAQPAGAQQGEGIINLEAAHPAGTSVHYIVRVTRESDGRPATDSVVTATARGSDGTELTPVTLAPIDDQGRYANAIDFGSPGRWTVRFTSVDPAATAELTATIDATAAGGGDGSDSGDGGEGGFAPADDDTGASATSGSGDEGDSGMPIWLVVAAAVVVFGGAFLGVRTVRRYRTEASSEEAQFADPEAARTTAKASDAPGDAPPGPKAEA